MPPIDSVADGELPHGSFDITILETGEPFVADNFSGDDDAKLLRSNNRNGNPLRQKVIGGFWDGSCDLQCDNELTKKPRYGMTFVADEDKDGTPEPFMVVKSGRTFTNDDAYKFKATITKCVNPVIYATGGKTTVQLFDGITHPSASAIGSITFAAYLPKGDVIASAVWSATGLPTGISINASTGALTGTPTAPGVYTTTIKVTLANNKKGTRQFVWTIS